MFLLIEVEAMLIVEYLIAGLAYRGERVEPVLWDNSKFARWIYAQVIRNKRCRKSCRRVCVGGGDTKRRRSICWSFLLYVISCAKSAFCAKELQSRSLQ
jgi:hypothetical protein